MKKKQNIWENILGNREVLKTEINDDIDSEQR